MDSLNAGDLQAESRCNVESIFVRPRHCYVSLLYHLSCLGHVWHCCCDARSLFQTNYQPLTEKEGGKAVKKTMEKTQRFGLTGRSKKIGSAPLT
jgi:hypothetical protein